MTRSARGRFRALRWATTFTIVAAFLPAIGLARPPSVLVIVADDQRADTIHALGNPLVRTPALDALVARGTSFDRAYCMGGQHGAVCIHRRIRIMPAARAMGRLARRHWDQANGRHVVR